MTWAPHLALLLAAGPRWVAATATDVDGGTCHDCSTDDADEPSLLQLQRDHKSRVPKADQKHRVRIVGKRLMMTDEEGVEQNVLPLGGNYVIKAQPYFPPEEIVRQNARSMAAGVGEMPYTPLDGRKVIPVVRLGALMEGAMPHGPTLDQGWVDNLTKTVEIFAEEGVYVSLDPHSDAWASTNGGEGFPYWMMKYMQESDPRNSYTVSPKHPLRMALPDSLGALLEQVGVSLPEVRLSDISDNGTDPWYNFSLEDKEHNAPWRMNVGNPNIRANNDDSAWQAGILILSAQSNNIAWRFYNSYSREEWWCKKHRSDRKRIFEPFVAFMKFLAEVWQDHPNVISVEVLNEPTPAGLPNLRNAIVMRQALFNFYNALLDELDDVPAVYALTDIFAGAPGSSPLADVLGIAPLGLETRLRIKRRADRGQLMFSFHYYPGIATTLSFEEMIKAVQASEFGGMPLFLSEFFRHQPQENADMLKVASELGVQMSTYWHYVDKNFTGNDGWFIFPKAVQDAGGPMNAWPEYLKTVQDGTFWGADITGAGGGKSNLLRLVGAA